METLNRPPTGGHSNVNKNKFENHQLM